MNGKISPTDLAKIFGVSRQYIYSANRNDWTAEDVEKYAEQMIINAEIEASLIKERLSEWRNMTQAQARLNSLATPAG